MKAAISLSYSSESTSSTSSFSSCCIGASSSSSTSSYCHHNTSSLTTWSIESNKKSCYEEIVYKHVVGKMSFQQQICFRSSALYTLQKLKSSYSKSVCALSLQHVVLTVNEPWSSAVSGHQTHHSVIWLFGCGHSCLALHMYNLTNNSGQLTIFHCMYNNVLGMARNQNGGYNAFKRRYFTWWWILRVWRQICLSGVAPTLQWH